VLSEMTLVDGSASQMIPLLQGRPTMLFFSYPVANGCWWIPVVQKGKECRGAPASRPAEFGEFLHELVTAARPVSTSPAEIRQTTDPAHLPAERGHEEECALAGTA
jgi:hypothetical protein